MHSCGCKSRRKLIATNEVKLIAAVSGVGYLGMMLGPPLIGLNAEHSSQGTGLLVAVAFSAFMTLAMLGDDLLRWREEI